MYPTSEEKAFIDDAEQLMVETMARYDPSHDGFHVQRVRRTALAIARSLGTPDLLIVEIAAILHDLLDKKYVTSEQSADPFILPLFQRAKEVHGIDLFEDGRARQIPLVVDNVSWTTEKKLREAGKWTKWHGGCIELHCAQDAGSLDAIGAFARFMPLEEILPDLKKCNTTYVKDSLKTDPGKQLGDKRHKLLLSFMQTMEEEYNSYMGL